MKNVMKFVPLLIIYVLIVLVAHDNVFQGDEGDYVGLSRNLSRGLFSPKNEIDLWFGPGYPIILMPFSLLGLPWLSARLMNPLFLFIAIIYFYSALRLFVPERPALYSSYLLGVYPPFLRYVHLLAPETLVIFLVCAFLFYFCRLSQNKRKFWTMLFLASFSLGYLALTKVLFGYVALSGLILSMVLYLWKRTAILRKSVLVFFLALIFCLPYLYYTYSLTGKFFYWGNSGGLSLYWMASPYESDLGSWESVKRVDEVPELSKNHREFFSKLAKLSSLQKDEELKKRAIYNILHHPGKFIKNWGANIGRLLFNYPYSYVPQQSSTYFYIVPNMFLVVISTLCIYPTFLRRKSIPHEVLVLLLFALIIFGGSSLLSAYDRQFMPIVPILLLWIAFTIVHLVKVEIR